MNEEPPVAVDPQGEAPKEPPKKGYNKNGFLTANNIRFCDLVVKGLPGAKAYRIAYAKPKMKPDEAGDRAWRVMSRPHVKEYIEKLRERIRGKILLTVNDRIEILAKLIQDPATKPSDAIRAIEVYTKIAGDHAPTRVEVTGKDGRDLIPAEAPPAMTRVPIRARGQLLLAAMEREAAAGRN
jgi:hypothetical protein